jgi:concanavalin A-like lectin/glucanase superfamily protein
MRPALSSVMRVVVLTSVLVGCGFAPTTDDVQGDAQLNGGPTTPLTGCHTQIPDVRLCLDFEDLTLDPVIRDGSTGGHDASSAKVDLIPRANQHAAELGYGSAIHVPEVADLDIPKNLSIEMWVAPTVTAGTSWPLSNALQYGLGIDEGKLYCVFGSHTEHAVTTLSINTWTHVACTWDGATVKAYVGGGLAGCAMAPTSTIANVNTGGTDIGLAYVGALDDVHVYARVLAVADVRMLAGVTSGATMCPMD